MADTATCILIVKNTSLEEISERFNEENHLMQVFQENSNRQHAEKSHSTDRPVTDFSEQSKSSASVQTDETTHSFLFIKSDLRLVTDLQHCIKTQQKSGIRTKR